MNADNDDVGNPIKKPFIYVLKGFFIRVSSFRRYYEDLRSFKNFVSLLYCECHSGDYNGTLTPKLTLRPGL